MSYRRKLFCLTEGNKGCWETVVRTQIGLLCLALGRTRRSLLPYFISLLTNRFNQQCYLLGEYFEKKEIMEPLLLTRMHLSLSFLSSQLAGEVAPDLLHMRPATWGKFSKSSVGWGPWLVGVSSVLNVPNAGLGSMLNKHRDSTIPCWWAREMKTNKIKLTGCSIRRRNLSTQTKKKTTLCLIPTVSFKMIQ